MGKSKSKLWTIIVIFDIIGVIAIVGYGLYEILTKIWPIFITIIAIIIIGFIMILIHPYDPNQR